MGDLNQLLYLRPRVRSVDGAVLEVGSKDYGNTVPFRSELEYSGPYVGIDMEAGKGVDRVGDLTEGLCGLEPASFALILCCSVLEHVRRPWIMAENLTRLLAPGGTLFIAVPWVWRYHGYPEDYFRYSHRGIMELFPALEWHEIHFSTYVQGVFHPIHDDAQQICDRLAVLREMPGGAVEKYLPYLQVLMLGTKEDDA